MAMATIEQETQADAKTCTLAWRYWSLRIAVAVLVPILILGLVEASLRIFGVGKPTGLLRSCTVHGSPAFCNNVFFTKPFFPAGMIRAPYPFAIPADKPQGTFRIFILGESAAYGDPDPAYGFSRYLDFMLREQFPGMKFEVINTAATAINSHVILPMARELTRHRPDLFIIYTGNNEVVGPYGPGTVLTRPAVSLPVIRTSILLRQTRLGQLVAGSLGPKETPEEWHGMEMFLDRQVPTDNPLLHSTYRNFAENLRDIIAVAHRSGARVIVSTVATNLKDCAPFASSHRQGIGKEALARWIDLVQRGAELEQSGYSAEALRLYRAAADVDDRFAELHFRIARCQWSLRDYASARENFAHARDLDTLRFRADSQTNEVIHSVATAAGLGVELLDAEKLFAGESPNGITGSELLYEHVHLNPRGNYLLARALVRQVARMLPEQVQRAAGDREIPSEAECERLLAFTAYDRSRLAGEILQRLERPPFTNQLNQKEQIQKLSFDAQAPVGSFEETVAQYEWAIAQNPGDHLLHLNYGLLLYDRDPAAAAEQFRRARPYEDIPFVAPDGTLIR